MQEIDTIIDARELPDDERLDLAMSLTDEVDSHLSVKSDALSGNLETQTFCEAYIGASPAEALGRAYSLRDIIERHTSHTATAELTGTKYVMDMGEMYEVRITIT